MRPLEIKGNDADQKLKHVEVILRRMTRRLQKTVVGLIPSTPIFGYVESIADTPVILRAIFPAEGTITKAAVAFEPRPKKGIEVEIKITHMHKLDSEAHTLYIPKNGLLLDIDYKVSAGTQLKVTANTDPDFLGGLWLSLLYEVSVRDMNQVKFAIDQLDHIAEEVSDATNEEG